MTDKLRGIEQLHPQNHDLWHKVQRLVALRLTWEEIAFDCGLIGPQAANELVAWVLAYKEPKRLPMVRSRPLVIPDIEPEIRPGDTSAKAQRFMNWRRQNQAARQALEAMGK